MLLSARILQDVQSVNSFRYSQAAQLSQGDTATIYIQLVDASLDRAMEGYNPAGRRYIPASGATLAVTLPSLNQLKQISGRAASQPFPGDLSIWSFTILSTDIIRGTVGLQLALNEGGKITSAFLQNAMAVFPTNATPNGGF